MSSRSGLPRHSMPSTRTRAARSTRRSGASGGVLSITGITRSYLQTWDAIDATVLVRSSPVAARRDEAIHRGLAARLEQLREERERRERAARAEDEAFSAAFLNAAREVFMLMDKDDSGSLSHQEILGAVKTNAEVKKFLNDCGDRNLQ